MIKKYHEYKLILEEDEQEQEAPEETNGDDKAVEDDYARNATSYAIDTLNLIELKLIKLFEEPASEEEYDQDSFYAQGIELMGFKKTDMPLNKTLILKFMDNQFIYHVFFNVTIDQGLVDKEESGSDTADIKNCSVKFKKYDLDQDLVGQIDKMKVAIETIDKDFIDMLNAELDQKYSIPGDDFEIEYEDE